MSIENFRNKAYSCFSAIASFNRKLNIIKKSRICFPCLINFACHHKFCDWFYKSLIYFIIIYFACLTNFTCCIYVSYYFWKAHILQRFPSFLFWKGSYITKTNLTIHGTSMELFLGWNSAHVFRKTCSGHHNLP